MNAENRTEVGMDKQITGEEWVEDRFNQIKEADDKEPQQKVDDLLNLASELLPSPFSILYGVIAAVKEINSLAEDKASILIEIISKSHQKFHSPEDLEGLLKQALEVARSFTNEEVCKIKVFSEIAANSPQQSQREEILLEAVEIASSLTNDRNKAEAVKAIAPNLSKDNAELLAVTIQVAHSIDSPKKRVEALSAISPYLPDHSSETPDVPSRDEVLKGAYAIASSIEEDPSQKAHALCAIAPHLPNVQLDNGEISSRHSAFKEALGQLKLVKDPSQYYSVLLKIIRGLPWNDREAVKDLLKLIDCSQALRLIDLADSSGFKPALQILGLVIAWELPENNELFWEGLLGKIKSLKEEKHKVEVIMHIHFNFPASVALPRSILDFIGSIKDEQDKAKALSVIVSRLPQALLEEALKIADVISGEGSESDKAEALSTLASYLSDESQKQTYLEKALELAAGNDIILGKFAFRISEESHRQEILNQILSNLDLIRERNTLKGADSYKSDVLSTIAPLLFPSILNFKRALNIAAAIDQGDHKVQALTTLISHAPQIEPDLLQQILSIFKSIEEPAQHKHRDKRHNLVVKFQKQKIYLLSKVAFLLPESHLGDILEHALVITKEIEREDFKSDSLKKIAKYLSPDQKILIEQAQEAATLLENDQKSRNEIFGKITVLKSGNIWQENIMQRTVDSQINLQDKSGETLETDEIDLTELKKALRLANSCSNIRKKVDILIGIAPRVRSNTSGIFLDSVLSLPVKKKHSLTFQAMKNISF